MTGRVSVDFCGTQEEHASFIKEHSTKFPKGLSGGRSGHEVGPNGDFMLVALFTNHSQLSQVISAFESFGDDWPREHQEVYYYHK